MAIPDFESMMLPLLKFAGDNNEHSVLELIEFLAEHLQLTDEEKRELLPSGKEPRFDNRVRWALFYLKRAGLLESTKRGFIKITQRGLEVLQKNPATIDKNYLMRFPEYVAFTAKKKEDKSLSKPEDVDSTQTPQEILEYNHQKLKESLSTELLDHVKKCSPDFFERLVVDLLVKMGYGGSRKEAGEAIGKTVDGGIDGRIKEDKLGLDVVYIQAKRWENATVGRPEIQKFAGALQGERAKKGIFITTSSFSKDAQEYVSKIEPKIVLIDGETLADLMIDHNVGVTQESVYEVKKIDVDYFP